MDNEKRRLRDEVAELAEAVRDLRGQLAQRDAHHCCYGWHSCCGSLHWHGCPNYPAVTTVTYPQYQTVCGTTSVAAGVPNATVTYTNVGGDTSTALGAINYS